MEVRDLTVSLGLRNRLTTEFRIGNDDDDKKNETADEPDYHAGLYLDLPTLSTKFTALESVDDQCEPLASSSASDKGIFERVITNAYSIEPSVKMDFGVDSDVRESCSSLAKAQRAIGS